MNDVLSKTSDWQRERATLLHQQFLAVSSVRGQQMEDIQTISEALEGRLLCNDKFLKCSPQTLHRAFVTWRDHEIFPRQPEALISRFKPGRDRVPAELVSELHRLATMPGCKAFSVAIKALFITWKDGGDVPGLGCWPDWWRANHPDEPMPPRAPDFPFSRSALYNHKPSMAVVAAGTKGAKAAREHMPFVEMDYSLLRIMELVTLDDVRLDLKAIDPATGNAVDLVAYCVIDGASRMILGFVLRPDGAINQSDVDALLGYVLRVFGIGDGYQTHIIFERGTIACSEAKQRVLEGLSDEGIKVHRTGMSGGIRWIGQGADKACGNPYGKAIIESFNRTLHLLLNRLPGQRGNNYQNQPQNLDTVCDEAEKLAGISAATGTNLKLPLLYISDVAICMDAAIKYYNNEMGHNFEGHGVIYEQEVQPGVWEEYHPVTVEQAETALELIHA